MRKILSAAFLVAAVTAVLAPSAASAERPGRYIVVFEDSVARPGAVARQHAGRGAEISHVYRHAIGGYAARMTAATAAGLAADPRVAFVERDHRVTAFAQDVPTGIRRTFATANATIDIDGSDDLRVDVDVAVIDTGIDFDHPDLNVVARTDCAKGGPFNQSCSNDSGDDGNGHGTHVAGTIGAIDNGAGVVGMAPGARLWAVRVLDNNGSGYISWIVAGIDWVTARSNRIEVANMSLGCACSSSAMDQAIASSVDAGVVHVVAAGNDDEDAAGFSPANHPDVIAVSALADFDGAPGGLGAATCRSDRDDTLADFSNWGSRVEVAAPGVCILSTWKGGGYHTISGTSMASPHAAGAAALLASGSGDPTNQTQVFAIRDKLRQTGNLNWTDDSGDGIKEPLLDVGSSAAFAPSMVSGSGGSGGGDTNAAPVANDDTGSTQKDISVTTNVLANDTDADGDPLTVTNLTQPSHGTVVLNADQTVTYTPAAGYTGADAYTYTANDGTVDGNVATVTISVADTSGWNLTATGRKVKGEKYVDLVWSATASSSTAVDVYRTRDGGQTASFRTANDGSHVDGPLGKGGGTYTYRICPAGSTSGCSAEVSVSF
jgi:subtilisin